MRQYQGIGVSRPSGHTNGLTYLSLLRVVSCLQAACTSVHAACIPSCYAVSTHPFHSASKPAPRSEHS
ncbi:hypothetical protein TNCV_1762661 [Trichonephila clavipes]|nr:hypothetical protein TNCV_1762661 [Trichonephila clavipes]